MTLTTTPVIKNLPADFRSFYRLFRRACSASVLHRSAETVALRNLYRYTFRRAGLVYMRYKTESPDDEANVKRKAWLDSWNQRMDNTLSLLYNSSHTRGLPHQITKYLGHFIFVQRFRHRHTKDQGLTWNPQLPRDSPEYKPRPKKPATLAKQSKQEKMKQLADDALGHLREVARMAEGRDEVLFGSLKNYTRVKPRKTPPRLDRLPR
ncbi:hypothetical protein AGABI1DRAFT_72102 [Agaricus bisporus var. burnettii JB137-S8]|uniref:Uncharacterized protein n=1 Tax=Agaricus bisporus var. burnettii (strain JB137-S8 / ATCC MYA-4627 / FGSC 10392) TaxID=597362 RepID=K5XDI3_AGABU|nr:uncharacterized protein AGABI1DRAFT_72102 [Agaricus bisporus var. burnettii JB137-S8]EKM81217.1 hypothetical protein AGABI1DRAFT_72102 [Agaricus bisporus var. burnettii JB137-S8]